MQRRIGLAALCLTALVTAGCSFSIGGTTVDKKDLEGEISKQLTEQLNREPESVTCPGDLKGEVGQKATCEFSENGEDLSVKVTVTKVEDGQVSFDIEPDAPTTIAKGELEDAVATFMEEEFDFTPDSVTCPEDVDREKDVTTRCEYVGQGVSYPITVTVTKVDGIDFSVDVVEIPTVPASGLEEQIATMLAQQVGVLPQSVTCPAPLDGVVGTEMRCELFDGTDTYGLTVTVTNVEGTTVNFNIKVDDQPS